MLDAIDNLKTIYKNQEVFHNQRLNSLYAEVDRLKNQNKDLQRDCVRYRKLLNKNKIKF